MKIIADLHTHTRYSHGKGTVLDNVSAAMARELRAIGLTDHGPRSAPWVGTSTRAFRAMAQEVAELDRRAVGIKVLAGAECNIISTRGDLDLPRMIRDELDLILAGLHPGIIPRSGRDWFILTGGNWMARFSDGWRRRARVRNTEAVVAAVYQNEIDVITHPGYHLDINTAELAKACAQRGTAMEINARHHEMTIPYCREAAREGVRFVISSDAHTPNDVGNFGRGIAMATAAGLQPEQVLNSSGGNLFQWLEEKSRRRRGRGIGWSDWAEQPALSQDDLQRERPRVQRRSSLFFDWSDQGKVH